MRLGIDFRPALFHGAGIGRYAREMVRALPSHLKGWDELVLFGVAYSSIKPELFPEFEQKPHAKVTLIQKRFPGRLLHALARLGLLGVENFTGHLDLFHHTDFVFPPVKRTPYTVTVFDLLFMEKKGFNTPSFCRTLAKRVRRALKGARGVLVPSHAVFQDLRRFFPEIKAPVKIVFMGGDHLPPPLVRPGLEAPDPRGYFLSVGTFEPRKNHIRLLKAFESMAHDYHGLEMVMVGRQGWLDAPFWENLHKSPVRSRVRVMKEIDDGTLSWLYQNAIALAYPSLGEGFGLPVAEAMHFGCPIITSNRSSLPEVAGGAALMVDPLDTKSIASALRQMAEDRETRETFSAKALKRAKDLTWDRTAFETINFLRELLEMPDHG